MTETATRSGKSAQEEAAPARPGRQEIMAFVTDAATESALQGALSDVAPAGFDLRRNTIRGAIAALRKIPSPHTLIVDISGEDEPLAALAELAEVVEPTIRMLLIGDRSGANFYRQVTRGYGALEYLYKPLQHDMIARYFGPLLLNGRSLQGGYGGRVVSVTGVRGGVGASTIASNLAWHFGVEESRHTVVLDSDLHRGTCAMMLGAAPGPELRSALEAPDRIDDAFVERAARHARARLDVLAGEEALDETPGYTSGANARLLDTLRRNYNFVIVDLPFTGLQMHRELLMLSHHRVLVMDPTLASVRDTLQLLALPNGPMQPRRPMVVLNRLGRPGTLTRRQIEGALKLKIDVALPDLPKVVSGVAAQADAAVSVRSGFRSGMLKLAREVALLHPASAGLPPPGTRGLRQFAGRLLGLGQPGQGRRQAASWAFAQAGERGG